MTPLSKLCPITEPAESPYNSFYYPEMLQTEKTRKYQNYVLYFRYFMRIV